VAVEVLRPGRRTQLTQAVMSAGSKKVAVARAWHLAVTPAGAGEGENDEEGDGGVGKGAGLPPLPDAQPQSFFAGNTTWGYGRATEWRTVSGGYQAVSGAAEIWTRVRIPLVAGRPLDGLARLLIVADSANGVSAPYPLSEWLFIPPGVTMHVHRPPVGEWVLLQARSDPGVDGIGLTEGTLSDLTGRCGTVTQPLLVARR
jgi:acyl-CoA thioesterase